MSPRLTLALALVCLAPADALRADAQSGPVAEIVHFRLVEAVAPDRFLAATRAMHPLVEAAPGFVSRRLSQNDDGSWTDYIIWQDLAHALAAPDTIFADPAARAFLDAIDGGSVEMRHEPVLFSSEPG